MSRMRGFTLIEMMITVALLAILLAVAIPSFRVTIEQNQVIGAANDMVASLLTARSEAVKQERRSTMEKDGSWNKGWTVKDPDDNLIVEYKTKHANLSVVGHGRLADSITYSPSGRTPPPGLDTDNDYFDITLGDAKRCIVFSATGRPTVGNPEKGSVDNGGCP